MNNRTAIILISLIVILGFVLRASFLNDYPGGVTADEIQQGYTAYSILLTGKDEWGDSLPVFPRAFGDYKPPLYTYLTIPAIAAFGLNIVSVRLSSVILGTLTILVIFFLTNELFKDRRASLLAAFLLAVSYWHVAYSRIAWESNIGVFFFLLGLLFFLKGLKRSNLFVVSAVAFGLSIFSYFSFKLLTVLFVSGLIFLFRSELFKIRRSRLDVALLIFVIFVATSLVGDLFYGSGRRTADAAIFNSENIAPLRNIQVSDPLPQPFGRLINNRASYLFSQFFQNYFGYFSTTFLVSSNRSDSTLFNLPGTWLISSWEFLLFLMAIYLIIKKPTRSTLLLVLLLILAPVPAALTREYMHAQRSEILLFIIPIFVSISFFYLYDLLKKKWRVLYLWVFFMIVFGTFAQRVDFYMFHQFNPNLGGFKYGYSDIVNFTEQNKDKYDKIVFTKSYSMPQIFVAFYSKMDPTEFQNYSKNWKRFESDGMKYVDMMDMNMGKYEFRGVNWDRDSKLKNTLIVAQEKDIPPEPLNIHIVKAPTGKVIFRVIETSPQ